MNRKRDKNRPRFLHEVELLEHVEKYFPFWYKEGLTLAFKETGWDENSLIARTGTDAV